MSLHAFDFICCYSLLVNCHYF